MEPDKPVSVEAYDTPILRATIDTLPIDTLDDWLVTVRARRLAVVNKMKEVKEAKHYAYMVDITAKYSKQYDRALRALQKLDEQIELIERYVSKLRSMQLELEDGQEPIHTEEANA